jgi:hypothetical protein
MKSKNQIFLILIVFLIIFGGYLYFNSKRSTTNSNTAKITKEKKSGQGSGNHTDTQYAEIKLINNGEIKQTLKPNDIEAIAAPLEGNKSKDPQQKVITLKKLLENYSMTGTKVKVTGSIGEFKEYSFDDIAQDKEPLYLAKKDAPAWKLIKLKNNSTQGFEIRTVVSIEVD